jgi:plastocyanin
MFRPHRPTWRSIALSLLALSMAPHTSAGPEPGGAEDAQVVVIDTEGFEFNPDEVTVVRGRPIRFVIKAKESPHAFSIPSLDFEEIVLPEEPDKVIEVILPEAGKVPFRCRFHYRQGMVGTLDVVDPPAVAPP